MKRTFLAVLLSSAAVFAQSAPNSSTQPPRKELFKNERLTAFLVEIPAQQTVPTHRHDHDVLSVYVSGGTLQTVTDNGPRVRNKYSPGDVRFRPAPFSHSVTNLGESPFRVVGIEFADAQGTQEKPKLKKSHYCNPGSKTACVTEEYLFCLERFCAEDVTMGPGAKSSRHTHDTDHMLVGITDYTLDDDTVGKGVIHRSVKSGGVEYFPAGITHVLTNTSNSTVRFIAIIFR